MYQAKHYIQIFEAMRKAFGDDWYMDVEWPIWGVVWRKQIKEMFFDQNISIQEMIAGLDEAAGKRAWPNGTSFFRRLEDVCLKNRREARPVTEIDRGPQLIGNLLKR